MSYLGQRLMVFKNLEIIFLEQNQWLEENKSFNRQKKK